MPARRKRGVGSSPIVTLQGLEARATLPEGSSASMRLSELVERLQVSMPDTGGIVVPDGTKALLPTSKGLILVHQTPPSVFSFKWIANDSTIRHGPGTKYRTVRIALPYVIVLAVYERVRGGIPQLTSRNECFFSNEPLEAKGLDSKLCYPALLNCSKFRREEGKPLSWICTQHLPKRDVIGRPDIQSSIRDGLSALLGHLFESGFNLSSEDNELSSWFSASVEAEIDPRIMTVERWAAATRAEPLFVLDVPWLPTDRTLREIADRVHPKSRRRPPFSNSADFARVILNAGAGA